MWLVIAADSTPGKACTRSMKSTEELGSRRRRGIAIRRDGKAERSHVTRIESRTHVHQVDHALDQQSCSRREHNGKRNFGDNHRPTRTVCRRVHGCARGACPASCPDICMAGSNPKLIR